MNHRATPRRRANATANLAVYDGRLRIGEIEELATGRAIAYAIEERGRVKIGISANRIEAMRAVSRGRA